MNTVIPDLFEGGRRNVPLTPGAILLGGFAQPFEGPLVAALERVVERAPFRHMVTPGGHRMSVAMTNCGAAGWITDRAGYRYDGHDPESGRRWPPMPDVFADLAAQAATRAGFDGFARADTPPRVPLAHGDVVVWGGPARLRYHGVMPLEQGHHPLMGGHRINLTFRKAA